MGRAQPDQLIEEPPMNALDREQDFGRYTKQDSLGAGCENRQSRAPFDGIERGVWSMDHAEPH